MQAPSTHPHPGTPHAPSTPANPANPTPADPAHQEADQRPTIRYRKSEIEALADIAPTLKEAELRVLLELTRRQTQQPGGVSIGSRELATACKASRRNVQYALDALTNRGLLTARQGTATRPATYSVAALDTIPIRGVATTPPREPQQRHPGVAPTPPPGLKATPPRPRQRPLPLANTEQPATQADPQDNTPHPKPERPSDSEVDQRLIDLIDRIRSAKAKDFPPEQIAYFRRWLFGYMAKLGRDAQNRPYLYRADPLQPSDDLVAQFLSTSEDPRRLTTMLDDLMLDRKPCYSYGWFVAVALHRIHGVTAAQQHQARAQLATIRRPRQDDWYQQASQAIRSIAEQKGIR